MGNTVLGGGAYLRAGDSVCDLNGNCRLSGLVSPHWTDSLTASRPCSNIQYILDLVFVDRREIDPPAEGSDHDMVHHIQAVRLALRVVSTLPPAGDLGASPSYVVIGVEIRSLSEGVVAPAVFNRVVDDAGGERGRVGGPEGAESGIRSSTATGSPSERKGTGSLQLLVERLFVNLPLLMINLESHRLRPGWAGL